MVSVGEESAVFDENPIRSPPSCSVASVVQAHVFMKPESSDADIGSSASVASQSG